MHILITGFEPFQGSALNPSEMAAHALAADPPEGVEVTAVILPVHRIKGPAALRAALASIQPEAVICLGEASQQAVLSLERVAVNLLEFSIPDNGGDQPVDEPVRAGGPAAYFANLPLRAMLKAIQAAEVPAALSLSAGSYLCNQVMYVLLDGLAEAEGDIPAGFIHLPRLPEQVAEGVKAAPSMSLETSLRGLRAALTALAASSCQPVASQVAAA